MARAAWQHAAQVLARGGIIAYPTESCYGLGCDPRQRRAVRRLLRLKQRPAAKGLILVAATAAQCRPYFTGELPTQVADSWPGPYTWLLPARANTPTWLRGRHTRIALRVSAHPAVQALCRASGMAIVSTSANRGGQRPARSQREVRQRFGDEIDYIVPGAIGRLRRPTQIADAASGCVLRAG